MDYFKGGRKIMAELSEARKRANKKWNDANKDKQRMYAARSQAKKFIREFAQEEDLQLLEEMIVERREVLHK